MKAAWLGVERARRAFSAARYGPVMSNSANSPKSKSALCVWRKTIVAGPAENIGMNILLRVIMTVE